MLTQVVSEPEELNANDYHLR
ncbi:hypothetical protein CBM2587_B100130 [Cupriavidus taiwanensis]|uniref:Uncharacterized protein n=1 Tax=Cupriavidus taiwanensis TaxID=164546 RepID=A0A375C166_9BURK|nr:hypothetical protein CBM2587_B100130 [Cupriavidus taiwanensis]